jgi:hypothetical protein
MKRDMDLIRQILKRVEDQPAADGPVNALVLDAIDQATTREHIALLLDARLLEGKLNRGGPLNQIVAFSISKITWHGHEFLAAAKDDTTWAKAKSSVLKHGSSITFDLLLAWLKAEMKVKLGLPP